jgi:multidrug resistance efflux pump
MENPKTSIFAKPWVQSLTGIVLIAFIVLGFLFYKSISSYVAVDNAVVSSPIISIAPETPGTLNEVYVNEGDTVTVGQQLAKVDAEILTAKINGIIVGITNTPGQVFNSTIPVIKMIDPKESRVLATIKENEGLSKIAVGNPVSFTIDAFGSKQYTGIVEEVSPTSNVSSVVFNISDKRAVQEFTIKVKYDVSLYPEFKNGMSAKIKVFYK